MNFGWYPYILSETIKLTHIKNLLMWPESETLIHPLRRPAWFLLLGSTVRYLASDNAWLYNHSKRRGPLSGWSSHCGNVLWVETNILFNWYMVSVMVKFMCHLDWVTEYPDIILGVAVREFLERFTSESVYEVKKLALPRVGGPHPISWTPEKNRKTLWQVEENSLPDCP